MANEYELYLEASTRGCHAYFKESTVYIGEILFCEMEPDNPNSQFAIVVKYEEDKIVGHVPAELSKIFKFLSEVGTIEQGSKGGVAGVGIPKIVSTERGAPLLNCLEH